MHKRMNTPNWEEIEPTELPVEDFGIVPTSPSRVWVMLTDGSYYRSDGFESDRPSWVQETDQETINQLKNAVPVPIYDTPPITPGEIYGKRW